ncbi:MAG: glucokinase, partial [Pseudorhodoplanes sp.]
MTSLTDTPPLILVADIGASTSRFALAGKADRPEKMLIMRNDEAQSIDDAIERYLIAVGVRPRAAVLAVAA